MDNVLIHSWVGIGNVNFGEFEVACNFDRYYGVSLNRRLHQHKNR